MSLITELFVSYFQACRLHPAAWYGQKKSRFVNAQLPKTETRLQRRNASGEKSSGHSALENEGISYGDHSILHYPCVYAVRQIAI